MPARTLSLEYPVGGQDRRLALQKQKPYTYVYGKNIRSDDADEGRLRGGSRPGLLRAFDEQLDSGSPIWMLGQVREVTAAGGKFWEDNFNSMDLVAWEAASWRTDGRHNIYPTYAPEYASAAQAGYETAEERGSVRTALSDLKTTADYVISMLVMDPWRPARAGTDPQFEIYARLNNTTPLVTTDGIVARFKASDSSTKTIELDLYAGGVKTSYTVDIQESERIPRIFSVKVNYNAGDDLITVSWAGNARISDKVYNTTAGTRFGFGITGVTTGGPTVVVQSRVDWFKITYEPTGGVQFNRNRMIAGTRTSASASKAYRENNDSTLPVIGTGTMQAFPEGVVQAVEFLGKLYWTTSGSAGKIQEYTPATDTIADISESTGNTVPTKCPVIGVFQSRLVAAGDDDDPHAWYMCRFADATDWNYGASATDVGRAVAGTSTDQTKIGQPILAFASASDDYGIFGCISSLWLLRGNPAMGGTISPLSKEIGIIQNMAWCPLPDGGIAFMSRDGLYALPPGGGAIPQSVSREKLPRELVDLDNVNNAILMAYDRRGRGIHIAVTPLETATGTYYFLNWKTGSFHPMELESDHEPLAMMSYDADAPSQAGVLYGCRDGYVRMFSNTANTDDGEPMTCEVDYGPIPLNRGLAATADSLKIVLDESSDDVSWTFRSGNSPEEAYEATARASGTAKAGVNYRQSVRHFGHYGFLRFSTTVAARWAVESVNMRVLTVPTEARKV